MAYASTLRDAPVENGRRRRDEFYEESELVVRACKDRILNGSVELGLPPEHHVYRIVETTTKEEAEMRQELESACEELHLTPVEFNDIVVRVWYGLFNDGINWGRIVAFLAFCQHLCTYSRRNGLHFAIESIPPWAATFVDSELREWILSHGGWVSGRYSAAWACPSEPTLSVRF